MLRWRVPRVLETSLYLPVAYSLSHTIHCSCTLTQNEELMFDISQWDKIQKRVILGFCEYLFQKYWIIMVILAFFDYKSFNCSRYFSGLLPIVHLCSLILRLCILGQIMWPVQLPQRIHLDQCGTYKENTYNINTSN